MSQEELLKAQIRMGAMQAAVAWYCCHRPEHSVEIPTGGLPGQLSELMGILLQLRDIFVETSLTASNPDPLSPSP